MVTTNRAPPSQTQTRTNNGRDPSCPDQREGPQRARVDDDVMPYSVKKGDTLSEIARAHDTTVDELIELNPSLKGAAASKLRIGQDIDVPAADRIENKPPTRQQASAETQRSSRERAMAGETAARARVLGPYGTPAPSMEDIRGEGARMRRGMSGESVKEMQRKLNALGANPPLEVDGKFGPRTERALEEFQGDNGVQRTGVLGATTLEALEKAKPRPASERTGSSSGTGGTQRSGRTVDVGDIQGGTKAQRLAQIAERTATRMGTVGKCALGVNNSLIAAGLSSERGHAYQKAEQLARDSDFREVNVSRDQLARLPAGAVVVWGRSAAKPWGHVTVSLGDGREASDHVQRMITGGRYGTDFGRGPDPQGRQFRVFMPVG